LGPLASVCHL